MRTRSGWVCGAALSMALVTAPAQAQTPANMAALQGLAPLGTLPGTEPGRIALGANLAITGSIQDGTLRLPTLLPFEQQQALSLRDAFITGGNAAQLADGLGTRLGGIYQARAQYQDWRSFTGVSPAVTSLIAYTNATTASDSNAGKYFFANATLDGKAPASDAAAEILVTTGGATDVFGKAYGRPAGTPGSDPYGNARPFQTLPSLLAFSGKDYFGADTANALHLSGPAQDLRDSPSFPSGHTTYGTMESILLALLVPERYPQMVTRAAEYGHSRILIGAHYAMDVVAGRTLALHDVAHLLANDPRFVGGTRGGVTITDYPAALAAARAELTAILRAGCGDAIAVCAAQDTSRFASPTANEAFYAPTQTYGLPTVFPDRARVAADVGREAPEAGYLLTAAYPYLTLDQANAILTATQGPGGGFLDNGSAFGVFSRLNLHAASRRAMELAPTQ